MRQEKAKSMGQIERQGDLDSNGSSLLKAEHVGFILVVFIPLTALCLFTCTHVSRTMLVRANWIAWVFFLGPLLMPVVLYLMRSRTPFTAAVAVMIPLEVLAAFLAQYTLIGVSGMSVTFLLWANLIPVTLRFLKNDAAQLMSWILLALIALGTLLPQVHLGVQLLKLDTEAKRIVAYSYDYKLRTGTFPPDLSAYSFHHPDLREHFAFYGHGTDDKFTYPFKNSPLYDRGDRFSLRYYVGDRATAYWFSSQKGWFVEDD